MEKTHCIPWLKSYVSHVEVSIRNGRVKKRSDIGLTRIEEYSAVTSELRISAEFNIGSSLCESETRYQGDHGIHVWKKLHDNDVNGKDNGLWNIVCLKFKNIQMPTHACTDFLKARGEVQHL